MFSRALELYPQDAEIHYHMGIALQTLGKVQEAARSFMTALGLDPQVRHNTIRCMYLKNIRAALPHTTINHLRSESTWKRIRKKESGLINCMLVLSVERHTIKYEE